MEEAQRWDSYLQAGKIGAMAIGPVLLLVILFLMMRRARPSGYQSVMQLPEGRGQVELPAPATLAGIEEPDDREDWAQEERRPIPSERAENEQQRFIREQVTGFVRTQPNVVADLIKTWMKEDS